MNDKFFSLPEEKQLAIINAGYRVFSQNSYKKSPMNEIAAEAGISKSLLFHYFRNKRELYLLFFPKFFACSALVPFLSVLLPTTWLTLKRFMSLRLLTVKTRTCLQ